MKSRALIASPIVFAITAVILAVLRNTDMIDLGLSDKQMIYILIGINMAVSLPLLIANKTTTDANKQNKLAGKWWWITVITSAIAAVYMSMALLTDCDKWAYLSFGGLVSIVMLNNIKAIYG